MIFILAFVVWYAIGFAAFAWSAYWKMDKEDYWIAIFVSIGGILIIPKAIEMREEFKDLK